MKLLGNLYELQRIYGMSDAHLEILIETTVGLVDRIGRDRVDLDTSEPTPEED